VKPWPLSQSAAASGCPSSLGAGRAGPQGVQGIGLDVRAGRRDESLRVEHVVVEHDDPDVPGGDGIVGVVGTGDGAVQLDLVTRLQVTVGDRPTYFLAVAEAVGGLAQVRNAIDDRGLGRDFRGGRGDADVRLGRGHGGRPGGGRGVPVGALAGRRGWDVRSDRDARRGGRGDALVRLGRGGGHRGLVGSLPGGVIVVVAAGDQSHSADDQQDGDDAASHRPIPPIVHFYHLT